MIKKRKKKNPNFYLPYFQVGLKPWEAMTKLKKIEQENMKKTIKPLKEVFASEILAKLEAGKEIPVETTEIEYCFLSLFLFFYFI